MESPALTEYVAGVVAAKAVAPLISKVPAPAANPIAKRLFNSLVPLLQSYEVS